MYNQNHNCMIEHRTARTAFRPKMGCASEARLQRVERSTRSEVLLWNLCIINLLNYYQSVVGRSN